MNTRHINDPDFERSKATLDDVIERIPDALDDVRQTARRGSSPGLGDLRVSDLSDKAVARKTARELEESLRSGTYAPGHLQRIYAPKRPGLKTRNVGGGKRAHRPRADGSDVDDYRAIDIPTVCDRIVNRALLKTIAPDIDPQFSSRSVGFRPIKHPIRQALSMCLEHVQGSFPVAVSLDIKKFFDTIDRELLRRHVIGPAFQSKTLRDFICLWLEIPVVGPGGKRVKLKTGTGIPQGMPTSPFLANCYLHAFDVALERKNVPFVRYADDITLFSRSLSDAQGLLSWAHKELASRLKLTVHPDKSRIIDAGAGDEFDLLGLTIRLLRDGSCRVDPKPAKFAAFIDRMHAMIAIEERDDRTKTIERYVAGIKAHYEGMVSSDGAWEQWCSVIESFQSNV